MNLRNPFGSSPQAGNPPQTNRPMNIGSLISVADFINKNFPSQTGNVPQTALPAPITPTGRGSAPIPSEPSMGKPTTPMMDYWKKPVIGKMPLDQFVSIAGLLSQALAPETPMGRAGGVLGTMGTQMYGERMRREYEEPERELRRRVSRAQLAKAERLEKPTEFPIYLKSKTKTINPATGKLFTEGEAVSEYKKLGRAVSVPKGIAGTEKIDGIWHKGFRHLDPETGKYDFVPTRKLTKAETAKLTEEKPAMTEAQARKRLLDVAKYRQKLKTTGGMDELLYHMIQQSNPKLAQKMAGMDKSKLEETLNEHEEWLKTLIPGKAKKPKPSFDIEEQDARDAIDQGIPADRVREMYKRRTGKELEL